MRRLTKLGRGLKRSRQDLKARLHRPTARQAFNWLLAALLRRLRFCRAQIGGGRQFIKRDGVWYTPLWLPIAIAVLLASSALWGDAARTAVSRLLRGAGENELARFFAPAVQHWAADINRWAAEAAVDPHLLATVMQIESCGHPRVVSNAGAQGLFQVMPFHFEAGEDMLDPATNARRGASYLNYCAGASDGVIGLTLACYNGGPSVIGRAREDWTRETRKYYRWGVGIYSDAAGGHASSDTLDQWLAAGGARLCASALKELGIAPAGSP